MRLTESELLGADPVWLLEVRYAGAVCRWATRALEVESTHGTLRYLGGMAPEVSLPYAIHRAGLDRVSVELSLQFADHGLDVPALVAAGYDLVSATAELSLWVPGRTYEDRHVVLVGRLAEPTYGTSDDAVTCSVRGRSLEERAVWPSPAAVVDLEAWPNAAPSALGRTYPTVIDGPGRYDAEDGGTGQVLGSPALYVDTTGGAPRILVAGHRVAPGALTARLVRITSAGATAETLAVTHQLDGRGLEVAVIDPSSGALPQSWWDSPAALEADWWVRWDSGGGLYHDGELVRTAGDVLAWALTQSSIPSDRGGTQAARHLLRRYRVRGHLSQPIRPWPWLRDELLTWLPVSMVVDEAGISPRVWRRDATTHDAVAELVEGRDWHRTEGIAYDRDGVVNQITTRWAMRGDADEYRRSTTWGGSDAAGVEQVGIARTSQRRLVAPDLDDAGLRAESLDLPWVADLATAAEVARWMLAARALPARMVRGTVERRYAWLERGDLVRLTSAALGLTEVMAVVEGLVWSGTELEVTWWLDDRPARDRRS